MEKSNFALRLLPSLLNAAQRIAEKENCSVNQLINVALAEKIAILDEEHWRQRASAALDNPKARNVLDRLAGKQAPRRGDEVASKKSGSKRGGKALAAG